MRIINGNVLTMDGLTIPSGYVAVSGDQIARVGPMEVEVAVIHDGLDDLPV